jgi:hypothetical protein
MMFTNYVVAVDDDVDVKNEPLVFAPVTQCEHISTACRRLGKVVNTTCLKLVSG